MMVDFKKSKTPRHKKKSFRLFAGKFVCYESKEKNYKANYELHELGWNGNMTEYDRIYKFQKPHFFAEINLSKFSSRIKLESLTWPNLQIQAEADLGFSRGGGGVQIFDRNIEIFVDLFFLGRPNWFSELS